METTDILKGVAALQPIITRLMHDVDAADVPGDQKKAQVLELAGSIYEGARRLGVLEGTKELRAVDWSLLAPVLGLLIDGLVSLFKAVGLWVSKRSAPA